MSDIKHHILTTERHTWSWQERWGTQNGDVRDWSVTAVGNQVTLRRGNESILMSPAMCNLVIEALTEASKIEING